VSLWRRFTSDLDVCLTQEEAGVLRRLLVASAGRLEALHPTLGELLVLAAEDLRHRQNGALRRAVGRRWW